MVKYFSLLVFLMVISCISYHKNEHGIYEPKHPNYSLKDKKDFIFPEKLDTINLYKYHGYYDNGIIVNKIDSNWGVYNKFCSKGRLYGFGSNQLEEKNLNPNFANKEYYFYDKKNDIIKIESFVIAEGGQYVLLKYKLSDNGDTLTSITDGKKSHVFVREMIPNEWKRYNPDW